MGQRSTLCTHQLFDLDSEPSDSCFQHGHNFFVRNASDFATRNNHPALSRPGNGVDLFYQFRDCHERVMMNGNSYSNIQNCHAIQNLGLGTVGPLNFCNSNMLLAPAGRNLPVHQSSAMAEHSPASVNQSDNQINMDDFGSHNQLVNSNRGPCKRKDSELIPGIYYNLNGSANSSSSSSYYSLSSGVPLWGQTYESMPCILDPASFSPPEFGGRPLPVAQGSHRSIRNRSVSGIPQPECVVPPQNCILPGSYMSYPFQTVNNAWATQFGDGNIGDGGFIWNYNTLQYLQGRSLNSGSLHHTNTSTHAYTGNSPGTIHPSSMPNFHPDIYNVQVNGYIHHAQTLAPYQHPVNNLCPINPNLSSNGMDAGSTFPHFPASVDQLYRPRHLLQPSQRLINGSLRLLTAEDAAIMNLPRFYGVRNAIDQHEDMRLDIDDMSYEELLALEEQIGVVKTGLTEEFIIKHLKLKVHVPQGTALSLELSSRLSLENETCSICQVEYEEDDSIGTLDCGHAYHGECIKQWLLIKNLCPICKTSALATMDRR